MSPVSPVMGMLIYAFGFIMHFFMLLFMFYMGEFGMCLLTIIMMAGFAWGYNDCINWSKKWSDNEKKNL